MHRATKLMSLAAVAAILAACSGGNSSLPTSTGPTTQSNYIASCGDALPAGQARCFALMRTDVGGGMAVYGGTGRVTMASSPSGYGPSDLQSAYALPSSTAGSGQTVAIVDAFDDPTAEKDLGVYRSQYGLPACTTANGCFQKVNQTGGSTPPSSSASWAQEISLDLDMVSAVCPNCHILLVESNSASYADLGAAVTEAVNLGAPIVSNSYGGSETGVSNDPNYNHPGHMIVASSGDNSYTAGPQQPCSFATVTCIGGTNLKRASNARGWTETAWTSAGSGCSKYVTAMTWQTITCSGMRAESDVSADADPNTGVAVYDSTMYRGAKGWLVFGGTSVSSPVISSIYALAGNATTLNASQSVYQNAGTAALNDVTSGNNNGGASCSPSFICQAGVGYDGPTGNGTPNGTTAF